MLLWFRLWHCHVYRAVNHHTAGDIYKPVNHLILSTSDSKTRSLDCMNCNASVNQTSASKAEIPLYSSHQFHDWGFAVCNPCPSQAGKSDYPLISTSRIWKKEVQGCKLNWIQMMLRVFTNCGADDDSDTDDGGEDDSDTDDHSYHLSSNDATLTPTAWIF